MPLNQVAQTSLPQPQPIPPPIQLTPASPTESEMNGPPHPQAKNVSPEGLSVVSSDSSRHQRLCAQSDGGGST